MQAIIAIPETLEALGQERTTPLIFQPVCGVPLLARTIMTAARAGAGEVLLVCAGELPDELVRQVTEQPFLKRVVRIQVIRANGFDPRAVSGWIALEP